MDSMFGYWTILWLSFVIGFRKIVDIMWLLIIIITLISICTICSKTRGTHIATGKTSWFCCSLKEVNRPGKKADWLSRLTGLVPPLCNTVPRVPWPWWPYNDEYRAPRFTRWVLGKGVDLYLVNGTENSPIFAHFSEKRALEQFLHKTPENARAGPAIDASQRPSLSTSWYDSWLLLAHWFGYTFMPDAFLARTFPICPGLGPLGGEHFDFSAKEDW